MLRKLLKNKKAQNTAEYAILISLVVAGIIAMQTYAQRALQARVRDASHYMAQQATIGGGVVTQQYEPYYLSSAYTVSRDESQIQNYAEDRITSKTDSTRNRASGGYQQSTYNTSVDGIVSGL